VGSGNGHVGQSSGLSQFPLQQGLHETYAARERRLAGSDTYSLSNPAYLFTIQQRQRDVIRLLKREEMLPLIEKDILELGCGNGGVLLELLAGGANPHRLHGTDLLAGRIEQAHQQLPNLALTCADGRQLPYADNSFDLILQFTVFSSILPRSVCYTVAEEVRRVLRPDGLILWYDFWLNPKNKETWGIRPRQIRELFPDCRYLFHRITLAPPLARRVVPVSWTGALILERLRILNTHYLVAIRPN
jgi:SAM-dependent methyltransferase